MEQVLFLNFHNLVKIKIKIGLSYLSKKIFYKNLFAMYKRYKVNSLNSFDLIININIPSQNSLKLNRNKDFFIDNNYIFSKYKRKFTLVKVEIMSVEDNPTQVNIMTNIIGKIIFPTAIINSLIALKLNLKGICFVHSSAVSKNGVGIIFAGEGSSGKTFLVIESSKRDFYLLGDDFIFIGNKEIYSFIRPLSLEYYHRKLLNQHLALHKKIELILKKIISLFTKGYISLLTDIEIDKIFNNHLIDRIPIKKIYLLDKSNTFDIEILKEKNFLIDIILKDTQLIFDFLYKVTEKYSLFYPNTYFAKFWDILKMNLRHNFNELPCYKITTPFAIGHNILEKIFEHIDFN